MQKFRYNNQKHEQSWRNLTIYLSMERQKEKNKKKLESVKAAFISASVGTLASLPISLTHVTNTYPLNSFNCNHHIIITSALHVATYCHAIRRDFNDIHLRTRTCAAFGMVKASLDAFSGAVCVYEHFFLLMLVWIYAIRWGY
ncbi:hypothetical protein L1987_17548 [Smallanthus sonchifolius]|uniref:Uncharacterized protein n=1 Tax=Smallanthus sonchifolius TaxID=185202 RepID=A0ACB9IZG0_9ASTR|nr:hypothetical protein L1987_17548 [Smallanthus sonchifolius]